MTDEQAEVQIERSNTFFKNEKFLYKFNKPTRHPYT
jgi:hypothetical protein